MTNLLSRLELLTGVKWAWNHVTVTQNCSLGHWAFGSRDKQIELLTGAIEPWDHMTMRKLSFLPELLKRSQ